PVLFLEVKPPFHLDHPSHRRRADAQVRERFYSLWVPGIPGQVLYGISAIGTTFAVYTLENDRITPVATPRSDDGMVDVAPGDRWEHDLV
ncbi:hypothetical protein PLICRDRAFT_63632, partial [Plicaturopsis crispa FD-325 SS-3]